MFGNTNANYKKRKRALLNTVKKGYAFETHMHTSEASACSRDQAADLVDFYKSIGFSGIVITDHFFNGNTSVPSHLPWSTRVELFCRGYDNALIRGREVGLKVFFGWEYAYHGTEFLTYGLNKQWLLDHPDILSWSPETYLQNSRRDGAFNIHAHPFRQAPYIRKLRLFPELVDAVEVVNSRNPDVQWDIDAMTYARENHLAVTSGSDTHDIDTIPGGGILFQNDVYTIEEMISAIRCRKGLYLLGSRRLRS